jgi:hypothetical protein
VDNGPQRLHQINGLLDPSLIPIEKLSRRRFTVFSLQRQRSSLLFSIRSCRLRQFLWIEAFSFLPNG